MVLKYGGVLTHAGRKQVKYTSHVVLCYFLVMRNYFIWFHFSSLSCYYFVLSFLFLEALFVDPFFFLRQLSCWSEKKKILLTQLDARWHFILFLIRFYVQILKSEV